VQEGRNNMFDCCIGSKLHGWEFTIGRVKKAGVFQVQICEEETKCLIAVLAVNSLEVSRRTSQPMRNKMFDCCINSKLHGGGDLLPKILQVFQEGISPIVFTCYSIMEGRNKMFDCCIGSKLHGKEFTIVRVKKAGVFQEGSNERIRGIWVGLYLLIMAS